MNYEWHVLTMEERDLIRDGKLIEAIKSLRARLDYSLMQSKDIATKYRDYITTKTPPNYYKDYAVRVTWQNGFEVPKHTEFVVNAKSEEMAYMKGCKHFFQIGGKGGITDVSIRVL